MSSKVREGICCPPSLSICSSEAGSTLNHRLEFSSLGWKAACPSDPLDSNHLGATGTGPPTSQLVTRCLEPSFRPQIVQQAPLTTEISLWVHNYLFVFWGLPLGFLKIGTLKRENLSSVFLGKRIPENRRHLQGVEMALRAKCLLYTLENLGSSAPM